MVEAKKFKIEYLASDSDAHKEILKNIEADCIAFASETESSDIIVVKNKANSCVLSYMCYKAFPEHVHKNRAGGGYWKLQIDINRVCTSAKNFKATTRFMLANVIKHFEEKNKYKTIITTVQVDLPSSFVNNENIKGKFDLQSEVDRKKKQPKCYGNAYYSFSGGLQKMVQRHVDMVGYERSLAAPCFAWLMDIGFRCQKIIKSNQNEKYFMQFALKSTCDIEIKRKVLNRKKPMPGGGAKGGDGAGSSGGAPEHQKKTPDLFPLPLPDFFDIPDPDSFNLDEFLEDI